MTEPQLTQPDLKYRLRNFNKNDAHAVPPTLLRGHEGRVLFTTKTKVDYFGNFRDQTHFDQNSPLMHVMRYIRKSWKNTVYSEFIAHLEDNLDILEQF